MMLPPLAALLLGLVGCGAPSEPVPEAEPDALGWIGTLARDPDAFSALMESTGREGWVALHGHDDARATASFGTDPVLRSRPAWKVSTLAGDLAGLSHTAHQELFTAWNERGELPAGGAAIAAWSAWCGGADPGPWLAQLSPDDPGAPLAARLSSPPADWPTATDPATERIAAHHAALSSDPAAPWDRPQTPVLEIEGEVKRTWYDPCFHAVARGHAEGVATEGKGFEALAASWTERDLAGSLFAPWLSTEELAADLEADRSVGSWGVGSARAAGLVDDTALPGEGDDAQAAREESRVLAKALGDQLRALETAADDNGKALLIELRLGEHWRQQWQLARARMALEAEHPKQALAYADLGIDFANGAGAFNPPGLFAVRSHALLQLGRTREALDALHALDAHRGVRQLAEVVGDLAVLEGLDRTGDSKEN